MKLDKIKFASLIGFLSCRYALTFTQDDIRECDELIDIEVPTQTNYVPCEAVDYLMALMAEGTRKIETIKAYRVLTGAGIKESKDAVEKYWPKPADTRIDSMLKKIDEQINNPDNEQDYILNNESSLFCVKDFIKSFTR